ncbi:hypothetical protein F5B17DRAFT_270929 [Nemania serpens]|nr:hypothetical protein F5B17DRAFT_270929 [Nemania serpens]
MKQATDASIPLKYWPIICKTAAYIMIKMLSSTSDKSAYENWYGEPPVLDHMQAVRTPGRYLEPAKTRSVFKEITRPCKMLGYQNQGSHNYTILLDDGRITSANNVVFINKVTHEPLSQPRTDATKPLVTSRKRVR